MRPCRPVSSLQRVQEAPALSLRSKIEPQPPSAAKPDHAFFEQPVFEGEIGDDLFERLRLAAKVLDFVRRRGAGPIPCKALLGRPPGTPSTSHNASTKRCLRGDTSSQMLSSPRRPSSTMGILSSAEKCRRVARRMSLIASSAAALSGPDFCLIFAPCGYDDPEILPKRNPQTVPRALTTDIRRA